MKSIYKDQFDSIRKTRVQSKEHCASLIAQITAKSVENSDLNAQLQEKVFAIASLKNELRKLKGKNIVDTVVSKSIATIASGMFKLDIEPISYRLKNNRDAHEVYLEKTIENTDTFRGLVECARKQNHINTTTSASGSKPLRNTKKNRISRPPSSNQKNKVEEHPRKVKSSLNKLNSVSEPISNAHVKHSVRNAKFESICAICNTCLFDANHDMCVINYVNDVNVSSISKSKRNKMRKVWKPMGKMFNEIRYSWKPTSRTFTIVGNKCPLTRFTYTKVVPTKETTNKSVLTPTQGIIVYSRRPKAPKLVGSSRKSKITESRISNSLNPTQSGGSTVFDVTSSSLNDCRFENDHIAKIMGYGDYQMGNITISRVLTAYYEEVGISHQTSVARTPQQNGVVKSQNCTLVEAADTVLIFSKALKPDLSYLHVFGALCYLTNDGEDLCKLKPKADIGIFVGYAPTKKAFRIYNKRTRMIIETIHVDFDELTAMAYKQFSSGPEPKLLTPRTISSGLVQNIPSSTPYVPPTKNDWEILFQPMFEEYLNPPPCVDLQVLAVIAPEPAVSTGTPSSTIIDQDVPSTSTSQTNQETPSLVISLGVKEADHDIEVAHMDNNPYVDFPIPEPSSEESSSQSYKGALTESDWIEAMQEELNEFKRLEVWELVPRPDRVMIITLKWIYKVKLDELRETCNPVDTPMVEKSKLDEDPQGKVIDPTRYRGMIGTLMYLTSNADHAGCQETKKSMSTSMQLLGDRLVRWSSKKQKSTTISSTEAEYIAFVIALCCNNVQHSRSKHIDIRHHFIKEQVENRVVELYFVRTEYQLAYIFTKPLARERLGFLINKFGMRIEKYVS
ncbi:retrovirus-related pol polyprotein from transposon TNT 1-94 [Tanacetum coccineum]